MDEQSARHEGDSEAPIGNDLNIEIQCSVEVSASAAANQESEIEQAPNDLGLQYALQIQRS